MESLTKIISQLPKKLVEIIDKVKTESGIQVEIKEYDDM